MLYLYRRVIFGPLVRDDLKSILDLDRRELATLVPLVAIVLWMGLYPKPFLDVFDASVENLVTRYQSALNTPSGPSPKPPERMLATRRSKDAS
jgi:NADH-quinone oxidoreductase subunit M